MVTDLQKRSAEAIVNVFETGTPRGDYGQVTVVPGDTGHLTYGRSQTTLASGNLYLLVKAYCESAGALYGDQLRPYLSRLADRDTSLDTDMPFRLLLKDAGGDVVMHQAQDAFFNRVYWEPSAAWCSQLGLGEALSNAVVYDSCVHGSWKKMLDKTVSMFGQPSASRERLWVEKYIDVRKDWLANNANLLLRKTVYRMTSFEQLIKDSEWALALPFKVRGVVIDESVLADEGMRASAHDPQERILRFTDPYMVGQDVRAVQETLRSKGYEISNDGIYGPLTAASVRLFQQDNHLKPDGIVGPATRAALGL
jgi:chitosanase